MKIEKFNFSLLKLLVEMKLVIKWSLNSSKMHCNGLFHRIISSHFFHQICLRKKCIKKYCGVVESSLVKWFYFIIWYNIILYHTWYYISITSYVLWFFISHHHPRFFQLFTNFLLTLLFYEYFMRIYELHVYFQPASINCNFLNIYLCY